MNAKRSLRIYRAGIVAASVVALTACGGGTAGPAEEAGPPAQRDSIVVAMPAASQSLNPAATQSPTDRIQQQLTNGTLFTLAPDGKVTPGLATDFKFNADYTQGTATLQKDLKFSDSSPLTAEDVAASFDFARNAKGSSLASYLTPLASVTATDETTVTFNFSSPYPSFESFLPLGSFGVYPSEALAAGVDPYFNKLEVTAGQYKVESAWAGDELKLTANQQYNGPQPLAKQVTIKIVSDANSAISQMESGQIDFAGDLAPNFLNSLGDAGKIKVHYTPVNGFYDLRLWNPSGPFSDVNMRKAVNEALDRPAIVSAIWGDGNVPQTGFWPSYMPGHEADRNKPRDLEAARRYLSQTENCKTGCTVNMMYQDQSHPFASQFALLVQSQLAEIGITVKLDKVDAATATKRGRAGDYEMYPGSMPTTGDNPDTLLNNAVLGGAPTNSEFTGYNNPKMNDIVKVVRENLGDKRTKALADVEKQFAEDQPYVIFAPWVRGAATTLPDGFFALQDSRGQIGSVTK
jgi:peptide/nickel transport system substrate-binding protein